MDLFKNRTEAGQQLALRLLTYQNKKDILILALPRGGVPVAYEIAEALRVPMTVFLVQKLNAPNDKELAIGAVTEGNIYILNEDLVQQLNITESQIRHILQEKQQELNRRLHYYREGKGLPLLINKTIILVDDGIATGATFKATIYALKTLNPKKLIIAAPVGCEDNVRELASLVDEAVCLAAPNSFRSVSQWYQYFDQTSDEEVLHLLNAIPVKLEKN